MYNICQVLLSVSWVRHYPSFMDDKNKACGGAGLPGQRKSVAELTLNHEFEALKIVYQYLI